jgi:hypothetical protein
MVFEEVGLVNELSFIFLVVKNFQNLSNIEEFDILTLFLIVERYNKGSRCVFVYLT